MLFCSDSRDPGPVAGDPLKAVPAVVLFAGCADHGRSPREALRMGHLILGFIRMESGFNPSYIAGAIA